MDYFYSGQVRRYLTQFIRIMSNFSYKDATGKLVQVPVMYGDPSRQAASVLKKNTENTMPSAPFIACYIKGLEYEQSRLQDPTFVSKVQVRERSFDNDLGEYIQTQGQGFMVERIMPSPYKLTLVADLWSTSTDQKLQIFEQIAYLFNPSLELQSSDNYLDWTSLTVLWLKSNTWTSRQVPQGTNQDIDILTLTFETPIWITPPAKVKRLGVITKIIANAFIDVPNTINLDYDRENSVYPALGDPLFKTVITPGNFDLLVLNNVAGLLSNSTSVASLNTSVANTGISWFKILDLYPGEFRAGLSQLRLNTPSGGQIVAYISLDPEYDTRMILNFDPDTLPSNGPIGTVDAIINPETFNPKNVTGEVRYLILEDIPRDTEAWGDFAASANDIIAWTGEEWVVVFDSATVKTVTYITNIYTGIQYVWKNQSWSKSFEGIYERGSWSLVL